MTITNATWRKADGTQRRVYLDGGDVWESLEALKACGGQGMPIAQYESDPRDGEAGRWVVVEDGRISGVVVAQALP